LKTERGTGVNTAGIFDGLFSDLPARPNFWPVDDPFRETKLDRRFSNNCLTRVMRHQTPDDFAAHGGTMFSGWRHGAADRSMIVPVFGIPRIGCLAV
jgi:hypothetical protein